MLMRITSWAVSACIVVPAAYSQGNQNQELFDPVHVYDQGYLQSWAMDVGVVNGGNGPIFNLTSRQKWGGFGRRTTTPVDWSKWDSISFVIKNNESRSVRIAFKIEATTDQNDNSKIQKVDIVLPANTSVPVTWDLKPDLARSWGVKGLPPLLTPTHRRMFSINTINLSTVYGIWIYVNEDGDNSFTISDLKLVQRFSTNPGVIDQFGQNNLQSWPSKVTSTTDLAQQRASEQADLDSNPGPGGLEGTNKLLSLPGTGKWRTYQTRTGKWYFVHPSGKMFWAFGVDKATPYSPTITQGRESMFDSLPPNSGDTAEFWDTNDAGKTVFDFQAYNIARKYGSSWKTAFADKTNARLKSWGFNLVGPWADDSVYLKNEIPFTVTLSTNRFPTRLKTPFAYWTSLPDAYDPTFLAWMVAEFRDPLKPYNGLRQFVGAFVDGELSWGWMDSPVRRYQVGISALNSDITQPAKTAILLQLKSTYSTIQQFNAAWGTSYASWAALEPKDTFTKTDLTSQCQEDLRKYVLAFAQTYFSKVRSALTTLNLSGLYLGSREAWPTTEVLQGSMPYIDVYSTTVYFLAEKVDWSFPEITKPVLITEFSFGANDRGAFHPMHNQVVAHDQATRAGYFKSFVMAAARAPKVVGAIWFTYADQPTSGRDLDGENMNTGFVSVSDTPFPEMIQASRSLGKIIYLIRGF